MHVEVIICSSFKYVEYTVYEQAIMFMCCGLGFNKERQSLSLCVPVWFSDREKERVRCVQGRGELDRPLESVTIGPPPLPK